MALFLSSISLYTFISWIVLLDYLQPGKYVFDPVVGYALFINTIVAFIVFFSTLLFIVF